MQANMGTVDRVTRAVIAVAIGAAYLTDRISGPLAIGLGALAAVFLATSAAAVCPLYFPLGLNTTGKKPT